MRSPGLVQTREVVAMSSLLTLAAAVPDPVPEPAARRPALVRCVSSVRTLAPNLLVLRIPRPQALRFSPGHYGRIGLPSGASGVLWRPYSFVSAPDDPELEFLVTIVEGGALSSRLAALVPGDEVTIDPVAMGFFVEQGLAPGDTLWMLATGSGVGPYVSMLREGGVLRRWRRRVLVHSVRTADELAYADELRRTDIRGEPVVRYVPLVTRSPDGGPASPRIPELLERGELEQAVGVALEPAGGRVMVCGNPGFAATMRRSLGARGFTPTRRATRGTMVFEHYW
jgi:ferredoxin--NADP+ reductase